MTDIRDQHNWCLLIGTNNNRYNFKCTRCGETDSLELNDDGTKLIEKLKPGPCTRIRPLAGQGKYETPRHGETQET